MPCADMLPPSGVSVSEDRARDRVRFECWTRSIAAFSQLDGVIVTRENPQHPQSP